MSVHGLLLYFHRLARLVNFEIPQDGTRALRCCCRCITLQGREEDQRMASSSTLDEQAARYVEKHALEEHLSAAVDAAIRAQAPDALDFISRYLYPSRNSGGGGRSGGGPLALELHVKARNQDNPQYPVRMKVSDGHCRWSAPWPEYDPEAWTHDIVLKNNRQLSTGGKCALRVART